MLGLGRRRAIKVPTDDQGKMNPKRLAPILAGLNDPALVCAQAGNVNSGAFDPIREIADCIHQYSGWLHVDGAFGIWAAASPKYRALLDGLQLADSITVDSHKWLNVPYDSGLVFVKDSRAHHAAMTLERLTTRHRRAQRATTTIGWRSLRDGHAGSLCMQRFDR